MTNSLAVTGLIPRDAYGVELPSTADVQKKFSEKMTELKAKRQERAEARQEAKDAKIYEEIRAKLIEKTFNYTQKGIDRLQKTQEKFAENVNSHLSDTDKKILQDSIDVANGAGGTIKAAGRSKLSKIGSLLGSVVKVGLGTTVGTYFNTAVQSLLAKLITGSRLIPLSVTVGTCAVSIPALIVTIAEGAIVYAVYRHFQKKAAKGNEADEREKQRKALEEIQKTFEKIEKFCEEIKNDSAMLIAKRKTMKKRDFDKYLDEYLKSKQDFLKEIGANDYLRQLNEIEEVKTNAEQSENNKEETDNEQLAGASV